MSNMLDSALHLADSVKDAFLALTGCCCRQDATLKLNGRTFKVINLLGEGGFSYVYLAQDVASGRSFALKKIRCPLGSDSVRSALKEVEAYKRFRHPNIIRCLDSCVVQDKDDDGAKIIYLFLPYYKNGTVQHVISSHAVNGTRYAELDMLRIFLGTCEAVRAMHTYHTGPTASASTLSSTASEPTPYPPPLAGRNAAAAGSSTDRDDDEDEEEEGEDLIVNRGDSEQSALIGGLGSDARQTELLEEEGETGMPGIGSDGEGIVLGKLNGNAAGQGNGREGSKKRELQPWAHRDIKPANVMLSDDGVTPILMDFGSALPARIPIPTRQVALTHQDLAAEHCSMPFRAPELFDVKTGIDLTEAVDIWSLGCTLFAMAFGTSPFETTQQSEHGGSVAMAAMNGRYSFPSDGDCYSEGFRQLVKMMLVVQPQDRPTIDQVIQATEKAIARLQ